jgi:hypothetical protein
MFAFAVTANLKRETILNPGVTDGSYRAVRNTLASLSDRRPLPSRLLPALSTAPWQVNPLQSRGRTIHSVY